jgi:hypothetical protein
MLDTIQLSTFNELLGYCLINNYMKYIKNLLTILNQLKVYHWQTTSYAQHQALGGAYDALNGLIDQFIEVYMGKYGRIEAKGGSTTVDLFNTDQLPVDGFVDNAVNYLVSLEIPDKNADTDLMNIRDEMLAELNKLKYLLTLE